MTGRRGPCPSSRRLKEPKGKCPGPTSANPAAWGCLPSALRVPPSPSGLGYTLSPKMQIFRSLIKALNCLDEPPFALPRQDTSLQFHSPKTARVGLVPSANNEGLGLHF